MIDKLKKDVKGVAKDKGDGLQGLEEGKMETGSLNDNELGGFENN
jgi:hypothetical protein